MGRECDKDGKQHLILSKTSIYVGNVIKDSLQVIEQNISAKELTVQTILFAVEQVNVAYTKDKL
jgi:hypothetical protein